MQPEVHLRADQGVAYRFVAQTLADASKAGLTKIGFVSEPDRSRDEHDAPSCPRGDPHAAKRPRSRLHRPRRQTAQRTAAPIASDSSSRSASEVQIVHGGASTASKQTALGNCPDQVIRASSPPDRAPARRRQPVHHRKETHRAAPARWTHRPLVSPRSPAPPPRTRGCCRSAPWPPASACCPRRGARTRSCRRRRHPPRRPSAAAARR